MKMIGKLRTKGAMRRAENKVVKEEEDVWETKEKSVRVMQKNKSTSPCL